MGQKINLPAFYTTRKWQDSISTMPLIKRLEDRIDEIERKLPNMTLKERQELWKIEPYWEVSRLIATSKDFVFPK